MPDLTAKRTLVKSPPELWEELSEVERLAKHLGAFGEITITKLEPEHTVAWEGEHASGTVSIEPSGWGTKVTLHAELPAVDEPEPEPEPEPAPEPEPVAELTEPIATTPGETARRGFIGWLFRTRTSPGITEDMPAAQTIEWPAIEEPVVAEPERAAETEPVAEAEPAVAEAEPAVADVEADPEGDAPLRPERAREILDGALDALGAAHHRPFSRG